MTTFNTITYADELQTIRQKYGARFYDDENAINEAAELWGCTPNEHGVCRPLKRETVVQIGQCRGDLSFYKTTKGYWLMGISTMSGYSGSGYAPSVWDSIGYPTYEDARLAGVRKLIDFFEDVTNDCSSCNTTTNRKNAHKALQELHAEKTPQLTLF